MRELRRICQRADSAAHQRHTGHQHGESHHDLADILGAVVLCCHNHDDTDQGYDGGEGFRFQHSQERVVPLDAGKAEDPCSQCRTDVGTHEDADGLTQLHDAGVYQTDQHNGQRRRGLDGNGDAHAQQQALDLVGGHLLQNDLQLAAGEFFQTGGHDVHTIQEKRQTAQQGDNGKDIHKF